MNIHFIQHVSFEHPGNLLLLARQHGFTCTFTKQFEATIYPSLNDIDILVIMGGPMGVYDEDNYSWMKNEKEFIKSAIAAGKKVWGVCLGSQLVAEALGAKVYPHTLKEIGWWPVQLVNEDNPFTKGLPAEFTTFHWHGDTYDLPEGAIHIFKTGACANQGFIVDNRVVALQFHVEAMDDLILSMLAHAGNELQPAPYIQTEAYIKEQIPVWKEQQLKFITKLFENFLSL